MRRRTAVLTSATLLRRVIVTVAVAQGHIDVTDVGAAPLSPWRWSTAPDAHGQMIAVSADGGWATWPDSLAPGSCGCDQVALQQGSDVRAVLQAVHFLKNSTAVHHCTSTRHTDDVPLASTRPCIALQKHLSLTHVCVGGRAHACAHSHVTKRKSTRACRGRRVTRHSGYTFWATTEVMGMWTWGGALVTLTPRAQRGWVGRLTKAGCSEGARGRSRPPTALVIR